MDKNFNKGLRANIEYNNNVKANTDFLNNLKEKLPEFFTNSGSFDLEKFKESLRENNINELTNGYRLDFIGKNYAKKQAGERPSTIIAPDKDHNNKKENKESKNLFFSGDNLEVLRHLQQNYESSVDFIYIDPPYNTGLDDFAYPDTFEYSDEELMKIFKLSEPELERLKAIQGKSTHSAWLTFMYPRLYLAKKLLKDSGAIFISIDDNENANLKLLMDEIFGEESFIDQLMVEMSNTGGMKLNAAKSGAIAKNGELILIYAKNAVEFSLQKHTPLYDFVEGFDTHYSKYLDDDYLVRPLIDVINENSEIVKDSKTILGKEKLTLKSFAEIFPKSKAAKNFVVKNLKKIVRERIEIPIISQEVINNLQQGKWQAYGSEKRDELYYIGINEGKTVQYATLYENYNKTDDFIPQFGRSVIRGDYWKGFWRDMGNVAKEDNMEFKNGKKPIRLIRQLIKWFGVKNGVILDFFAGSATTASAVLHDNIENKSNNQYILVQIPENLDKRLAEMNSKASKDIKKQISILDENNRPHFLDELSQQRITNSVKNIQAIYEESSSILDLGFKHYYVVEPKQKALDKIEYTDALQLNMFDDMIELFSSQSLKILGNASGMDTILQTYMVSDNYKFDVPIKFVDFAGIELPYVNESRIYLITNDWTSRNTKALVNAIGRNELTVQTIVVYGYTMEMESICELEIALNQLENKVNLQVRY